MFTTVFEFRNGKKLKKQKKNENPTIRRVSFDTYKCTNSFVWNNNTSDQQDNNENIKTTVHNAAKNVSRFPMAECMSGRGVGSVNSTDSTAERTTLLERLSAS